MKIVFLNISQGAVYRGAETFVLELSRRLVEKGHRVEVITDKKNYASRWPLLWRFFIDPQGLQILGFTLKSLLKIWREKFDIVVPLNGGWQPALVRIVTWLYGGKMFISGQSGIGWDDRNNLWCFPNVFIALSDKAKNWAKRVNPLVRVEKIHNGVDIKKFSPEGEKLRVNLKKPIVVCVGALTPTKRIDLAIKAVAKLKKVNLLLVGDGDLRSKIKRLGEGLLRDRFQLIQVPFSEMPKIYRTGDVFTIPSESYYSFEIVLTEAMATNLPIVANDDPIRKEIVGAAGLFVDPTDTDSYSKALERALKTNWGDKPRKQAVKFNWDRIAVRYKELFQELTKI